MLCGLCFIVIHLYCRAVQTGAIQWPESKHVLPLHCIDRLAPEAGISAMFGFLVPDRKRSAHQYVTRGLADTVPLISGCLWSFQCSEQYGHRYPRALRRVLGCITNNILWHIIQASYGWSIFIFKNFGDLGNETAVRIVIICKRISRQYYVNSSIPTKDVSSGNLSNGMEVRSPMQNEIIL